MSLSFSTTKIEKSVEIDGDQYVLREASGKTAVDYQNLALNGVTFGADGKPTRMVGQASVQILLVGQCLYAILPSGDVAKNPVGEKWVEATLPAKVLKALFKEAKEISALGEEQTEESIQAEITKLQDQLIKMEEENEGEPSNDSEVGSD